jgi:acyl-CoA thioesterase
MSQSVGEPGPVEAMMASDAASRMLGIELLDYGDGWARTRLTVRDEMVNGHGICHGGMIFSLADTAFACACNSWGPVTVAAGADIVFIAPARLGDVLAADCRVRARYGRSGVYDVTVSRDGDLIAEFRGRSHELHNREPRKPGALPSDPQPVERDRADSVRQRLGRRRRARPVPLDDRVDRAEQQPRGQLGVDVSPDVAGRLGLLDQARDQRVERPSAVKRRPLDLGVAAHP